MLHSCYEALIQDQSATTALCGLSFVRPLTMSFADPMSDPHSDLLSVSLLDPFIDPLTDLPNDRPIDPLDKLSASAPVSLVLSESWWISIKSSTSKRAFKPLL